MIDRLRLTDRVIAQMADGIEEVAALPDPLGGIERAFDAAPTACWSAGCGSPSG